MERADQKHILVLITNPFAIINVIHSGLLGELSKHYRISIMSDLLNAADIAHFNRHFQLNMHWLPTPVPTISGFTKWLRSIQMLLFGQFFGLETIRIKLLERGRAFHWLFCISRKSRTLTFLSGSMTIMLRNWLIRRTSVPRSYASVASYHFQALISTSPLDLRENAVANSLKVNRITCISILISWDNLTSKGVINCKSDLVLVWNKQMAQEYQRIYSIFGDSRVVRMTGIPRFDIYFRDLPTPSPDSNMPAGHTQTRAILFSTVAVKHHSCQNYIIQHLLEYAKTRPGITILVRCHPGDEMSRYDCFNGIENLHFFQPFGENSGAVPPADFLEALYSQLMRCDVCVQVASTMLLDATACNKPCISIAYDARPDVHYGGSVRRFYDYSHQMSLPDQLREHSVYNREELFSKLDKILMGNAAPMRLRDTMKPVFHHLTPDSVRLSTQCIREWLG